MTTVNLDAILVATDFSEASEPASNFAFRLARSLGARLYLLHVVPQYDVQLMRAISGQLQSPIKPETLIETLYTDADRRLTALVESAQIGELLQERLIITGEPADEIIQWAAAKQVQLVIVGTHGHGGLVRFVLGSVAEQVLRQAPCAVIVVPAAGR